MLTISIPAYKRPALLKKLLDGAANQILQDNLPVSIFIADDSLVGANFEVIEEIKNKYPTLSVELHNNEKNLGIDENIKKCIEYPLTPYVWLIGEDDLIAEGGVAAVCNAIRGADVPFVFVNYIYTNSDHSLGAFKPAITEGHEVTVESFDKFAATQIWALGFIGACVIGKKYWKSEEIYKYHGSFYSHVGGIIDSSIGAAIKVIHNIVVLNRAEDVNTFTWSSSTFPVYFSFYDVLQKSALNRSPDLLAHAMNSAKKLFRIHSLAWLAAKRADGVYSREIFSDFYAKNLALSAFWRVGAFLISVFPKTPLKIIRKNHLKRRFVRSLS